VADGRGKREARRRIPSIDSLLRSEPGRRGAERFGRAVLRHFLREVLAEARATATRGQPVPEDDVLLARAVNRAARTSFGLSSVINATGVILHTGLGRAPLPERALRAVRKSASGYADLEVDRESGRRGRRTSRGEQLLVVLTGAEAALVVNNNAAALLLGLASLARGKQVLVSRGELIEIGGEFRLPDIMAASGAKLVEVGTTNRTRLSDYRSALGPRTGLILKVHPSNYRVVGFAETPSVVQLAGLARGAGVPLLYDLGSGLLDRFPGLPRDEPAATEALREGADVVCFSGDKLLGGPQAGIVLGRQALVDRLRRHPIARAVRVDKMQVAALEAVLHLYATGRHGDLPIWRSLRAPAPALARRVRALTRMIPGSRAERTVAAVGGGSVPGHGLPSWALVVPTERPEVMGAVLRLGQPPVFCRVDDGEVVFDLRSVFAEDDDRLARAIRYAQEQA
jgi:L-seryl-tRNA(Ser) seleniumtransferase